MQTNEHDPGSLPRQKSGENPSIQPTKTYASITRNIFRSTSEKKTSADVIWHRTLNQGAVVFDFSSTDLALDEEEAMDLIGDNYESDISGLKPLGYRRGAFEVNFKPHSRDLCRQRALKQGITVSGHVILAQDTYAFGSKLTKVKLRDLPLCYAEEDLVRVLRQGMGTFGEVRSVFLYERKTKRNSFFTGEGFILLDTTPKLGISYAKLTPFIHVPEWDITINATWEDSPLACRYCKQTGHTIKDCPKKAGGASTMRTCFHCKQPGHLRAECPELNIVKPLNVEVNLVETTNQRQKRTMHIPIASSSKSKTQSILKNVEIEDSSAQESSQPVNINERQKRVTRSSSSKINDSGASIHAPKGTKTRDLDPDEKMLSDDSDDSDFVPSENDDESIDDVSSQDRSEYENDDIMQDYIVNVNNRRGSEDLWNQDQHNGVIPSSNPSSQENLQTRIDLDMESDDVNLIDHDSSLTF
jgi:hypothetical protein